MTSRSSDPSTSKDAGQLATTPTKLRASHALILRVFELYGAMNDKDLIDRVHAAEKNFGIKKLMSPSGVRSRRSEMSKPNTERLDEIAREIGRERDMAWPTGKAFGDTRAIQSYDGPFGLSDDPRYECPVTGKTLAKAEAVRRLRAEGFKSKLWDTGKREIVDGRSVIVWGIAS